jgi:hypothetical protein
MAANEAICKDMLDADLTAAILGLNRLSRRPPEVNRERKARSMLRLHG